VYQNENEPCEYCRNRCGPKLHKSDDTQLGEKIAKKEFFSQMQEFIEKRLERGDSQESIKFLLDPDFGRFPLFPPDPFPTPAINSDTQHQTNPNTFPNDPTSRQWNITMSESLSYPTDFTIPYSSGPSEAYDFQTPSDVNVADVFSSSTTDVSHSNNVSQVPDIPSFDGISGIQPSMTGFVNPADVFPYPKYLRLKSLSNEYS
jgi:hypothetical protein